MASKSHSREPGIKVQETFLNWKIWIDSRGVGWYCSPDMKIIKNVGQVTDLEKCRHAVELEIHDLQEYAKDKQR